MHNHNYYSHIILTVLLFFHISLTCCRPQEADTNGETTEPLRNGRYVPELHGAQLGKYRHDESGTYRHVKVPYDGGYGDRGLMYIHDEPASPPRRPGEALGLRLGPKDHLRFSIDFNFDGSGWQIVEFDWVNDDNMKRHYDYKFENQLWPSEGYDADAVQVDTSSTAATPTSTNVHLSGEYEDDIYNVNYSSDDVVNTPNQIISAVLDYIQDNILPTLNK
uniref:Uncharacterized protein n=1 Tax=Ceratitis capitata TaxID=7213 RepID=W8BKK2_CERCA